MDRRTFVLLTGAGAGSLGAVGRARPAMVAGSAGVAEPGQLRFALDRERRWSLAFWGNAGPVPVIPPGPLTIRLGNTDVALADLEDSALVPGRPPEGLSLILRGRAAGAVIEAEFWAGAPRPVPAAAIALRVYPDTHMPPLREIRFADAPSPDVLPGTTELVALLSGYQSWSAARLELVSPAPTAPEQTSHFLLGLSRGSRALALAFTPGEPGEGQARLGGGRLQAASQLLPERPLPPGGETATLRLAYAPTGGVQTALETALGPMAEADRRRLLGTAIPAGWCSWYELFGNVTEDAMVANLESAAAHFDRRYFRYVQLDDGYQRATGDWEMNARFPHGHRWLTDRIRARGFRAGLWTAPFAVAERSGVPAAHPEWLLADPQGPIVFDTRDDWGGKIYGLDGAHPEVRAWLRALARRIREEWGYDYLKIDFLYYATRGASHHGRATHAEAYRLGLKAIREGLGPDGFLLGCGAPLQHAVGLVDGMRIGPDVDVTWGGVQAPARAAALRASFHKQTWLNDPDCLLVRPPLTEGEARAWASIVAASGGLNLFSDHLPALPAERVAILQRTLPVAPMAGRPLRLGRLEPEVAPALVVGDRVVKLPESARFRTGDDPGWAGAEFDDSAWDTIPIGVPWERTGGGRERHDGYAWYRVRFTAPPRPRRLPPLFLELGKFDDVDETFVNGVKVGQMGEFPPTYRVAWQDYRRYPVPADAVRWGGDNVLAARVYDGGGGGGWWSTRRDRAPGVWLVEGRPAWWTLVAVNWDDEPAGFDLGFRELGIAAPAVLAYDVWRGEATGTIATRWRSEIPAHDCRVLALRPRAARPQLLGTSRHVIQGAVDIAEEEWDAAGRALFVRSVNLDRRTYAVTVSVPPGMRASDLTAPVPATLHTGERGVVQVVLEPGDLGAVLWKLSFRSVARRPGPG